MSVLPRDGQYHHRLHKFFKRTLHKIYGSPPPGHGLDTEPVSESFFQPPATATVIISRTGSASGSTGADSMSNSSSNIFERSLEANSSRTMLSNPETPLHYSIENYTSPILDTTTEILSNPKVDFYNDVRLKCFYEDEDEADDNSGPDLQAKESNLSDKDKDTAEASDDEQPKQYTVNSGNDFEFRPRSRSIISLSLMSSFDQEEPAKRSKSISSHRRAISRTPTHREVSTDTGDTNDQTIEYYSFADMVTHEDLPEDAINNAKKGSYTISVKDYIGV